MSNDLQFLLKICRQEFYLIRWGNVPLTSEKDLNDHVREA
jgi:hypothetical protein